MENKDRVLSCIDDILSQLRHPVSAQEAIDGWDVESKDAARTYFELLSNSLKSDSPLPPLGIVRGLDHWGVIGGRLLDEIAKVTNMLR
jgi:hypothetical protein